MANIITLATNNSKMGKSLGDLGEEKAAAYLMEKGYQIEARNYRFKRNEVDIIARKNELLVFVEVKTKSYSTYGHPEEQVDEKKAARIIEAADQYVYEVNWLQNIRFDVISIIKKHNDCIITHFEDAFY